MEQISEATEDEAFPCYLSVNEATLIFCVAHNFQGHSQCKRCSLYLKGHNYRVYVTRCFLGKKKINKKIKEVNT